MTSFNSSIGTPPPALKLTLVSSIFDFVYDQLAKWRDDPARSDESNEEILNSQLCDFLNFESRLAEKPYIFKHEEAQAKGRRVDLSVKPTPESIAILSCSKYDNITVLEGKRLPTPNGKGRQKEYLCGEEKITGGVERFKKNLHGNTVTEAGLIGYIQKGNCRTHRQQINTWIAELAQQHPTAWSTTEQLSSFNENTQKKTATATSIHQRKTGSSIKLHHIWVEMN